ncbi:hypothetical protein HJC10_35335 [Corallococcus exiguus]|nr:hypothetical protein [Corallococcus exiguus]NNB95062.1 hypothetical protein [Corallococcus exiguus]NNC08099.1 hypothetical protein [Corallococcus exiguus]NPC52001.1 hypothetical protein [Corallococcus exiguus]RKH80576.1 hypothetical protein D7X99_21640 [Corallococcus sp. AB032C]
MRGSHRLRMRMDIHSSLRFRRMSGVVTRNVSRLAGAVMGLMLIACGGSRDDFIGARVLDVCKASWPVCSEYAGCILGPESYSEGRFPGRGQVLVRVPEASTIKVSFYLEEVTAAGEETAITVHEEGCRARQRKASTGRAALDQMEKFAVFTQQADVTGVGDHLVEFDSDMQARYVVKVDVTPLRLQ